MKASELRAKTALVREARFTHGKTAARELWRALGLPDIPEPPETPDPLRMFVHACLEITGCPSDAIRTREVFDVAVKFGMSQSCGMPTGRALSDALLAALTGPDCIVPKGMVRRVKRSGLYYVGLRVKTCAGTGVPALSAD